MGTVVFLLLLVIATALRLWASTLGGNYDVVTNWTCLADHVEHGVDIYRGWCFAYGPPWAYACWAAWKLAGDSLPLFHTLLAALVACGDAATITLLWFWVSRPGAILFALAPPSIIITGYHTQIEALAIPCGLAAWLLLRADSRVRTVAFAALLMGFGLAIKHIWAFFPLWLLLLPGRPWWQRALFVLASYGVFALVLVGFPSAWPTISQHTNRLLQPNGMLAILMPVVPPRTLLFGLMACAALWARTRPAICAPLYLAWLVVASPYVADQDLTLPVFACALWWRRWTSWLYLGAATLTLLASPNEVCTSPIAWFTVMATTYWRPWGFELPWYAQLACAAMVVEALIKSSSGRPSLVE